MKLENIQEGMYIQLYCDSNLFMVWSEMGDLYIDFRGEQRTLKSFGKLIYKVYNFDDIEKLGKFVTDKDIK